MDTEEQKENSTQLLIMDTIARQAVKEIKDLENATNLLDLVGLHSGHLGGSTQRYVEYSTQGPPAGSSQGRLERSTCNSRPQPLPKYTSKAF